jgi:adenylate kinase family enzyme
MKNLEFPITGTKKKGVTKRFDINSPEGRKEYFEAKVGDEIKHLKEYMEHGTFVAYMIGKKNSGKGTYTKLLAEIFGKDKIEHLSVGDIVREMHSGWEEFKKDPEYERLKKIYRGKISFQDAEDAFLGKTQDKLLPTEFILTLLKHKINVLPKKNIFIDGLPRDLDQISYALYFRDLAGYRDDPDVFVMIDIPESVIEERIKYRVICPICNTSRSTKLLVTSKIEYDENSKEFYLICDNPDCKGARMVAKEGDSDGIEPIRARLMKDEDIMREVYQLHGIPKVLLRNHVPANEAHGHFDDYELTPEFVLKYHDKKVIVEEKPWTVRDDNGVESNSLMAPAVVVTLIKQLSEILTN